MRNAEFIQPDAVRQRITRVRAACQSKNLDAFLVRDVSSIVWLTAFDGVFDDEQAHALLVTPDQVLLHTDSRYSTAAREAAGAGPVVIDDERTSHAKFVAEQLALEQHNVHEVSLGIEDSIALADYRALQRAIEDEDSQVQLEETTDFIVDLRAVKDPSEIERMKAAQAITDAAFSHIVAYMRPGMTEREVQVELEYFMRQHGANSVAFPSIVAAGPNGANPHAIASEAKLEVGQCVVLDFGACAYGYCSDTTRTVFIGEPDAKLRAAYDAMRQANESVIAALKPGVTGADMHNLAEQILADAGFGGKMGHGLGHGVGIEVHEKPVLAPRNTLPLEPGNVVTVEPGIYFPGEFGMRLEDMGVVSDEGFEVFTQTTHDPVVV